MKALVSSAGVIKYICCEINFLPFRSLHFNLDLTLLKQQGKMNTVAEDEIAEWLIEYNLKQFDAEDAGNFEEADLICREITNYIEKNAALLAAGTDRKAVHIKQSLQNKSSLIFATIKNNKQNVNHL